MRVLFFLVVVIFCLACFGCAQQQEEIKCSADSGCAVQIPQVQDFSCSADSDCVPAECCHSRSCVPLSMAPDCKGVFCTMECVPGTLDCGGRCACEAGKCVAKNLYAE